MKLKSTMIWAVAALVHAWRGESLAGNTYDAAVETHPATITRTNDAAVTARHLLWKQGAAAGGVAVCTAADIPLGTIDNTEASTGVRQTVLLLGKGDTKKMVAAGVIAEGAQVYTAAAGKVADSGTYPVGQALTAAGADGDIIEVDDWTSPTGAGVLATLFDAQSILAATADNTPAALTVGAQTIVGRITGGNIAALTGAQVLGILAPITWTATTSAADSLAIPITHRSVNKTTGADAEALSLANGAFLGQRLSINLVTDGGGDGTLTPTTASGFATIVFADAGDFAELEWTTAGWRIVGIGGLTAQPTVTA
jgi:hypothetical protein